MPWGGRGAVRPVRAFSEVPAPGHASIAEFGQIPWTRTMHRAGCCGRAKPAPRAAFCRLRTNAFPLVRRALRPACGHRCGRGRVRALPPFGETGRMRWAVAELRARTPVGSRRDVAARRRCFVGTGQMLLGVPRAICCSGWTPGGVEGFSSDQSRLWRGADMGAAPTKTEDNNPKQRRKANFPFRGSRLPNLAALARRSCDPDAAPDGGFEVSEAAHRLRRHSSIRAH